MANELHFTAAAGSTYYARVWNAAGQVWNTALAAFEAWADGNVTDYDVALAPKSGGLYVGDFPAAITAGVYSLEVCLQAGAGPAVGDTPVGAAAFGWNGTVEIVTGDLTKVKGTALPAESVAGRDAAALGKLLDVATPAFTAASVNQTADGDVKSIKGTALPAESVGGRMAAALGYFLDVATPALTCAANLASLITKFTGITLLAKWLQGMARKDAMDATAKLELNSGGGGYDETTDSEQALRDAVTDAVDDLKGVDDRDLTDVYIQAGGGGTGLVNITEATLDADTGIAIGPTKIGGVATSGVRVIVSADADTAFDTILYDGTSGGDGGFTIPVAESATYRLKGVYQGYEGTVYRVTV